MSDPFPNSPTHSPPRTVEWIEGFIFEQIDKRLLDIQEKIAALQDHINKLELEKQELLNQKDAKIDEIQSEKVKLERLLDRLTRIQEKIEEEVLNKTFSGEYLDTLKPVLFNCGVDVSSMNVENTYTSKSSYRDENEDNLKMEGEENYGRE